MLIKIVLWFLIDWFISDVYNIKLSFYFVNSFQLVDASTLKKEVAEGVDLMVVRELTGGQYTLKGIEVHSYCEWFFFL